MPDPLQVPCGGRAAGRLRPPSSKSQTQRYYNLALLSRGPTTIERVLHSEDCDRFAAGLRAAGCRLEERDDRVRIEPPAAPGHGVIDCGASGTMMRLLTAALCAVPGRWRVDGAQRLRERPLAPLVEVLADLGAQLDPLGVPGFVPLEIAGGRFRGGRAKIDASESSQFVSALLMLGAVSTRGLTLEVASLVSQPYVELTRAALTQFGAPVSELEPGLLSVGPVRMRGARVTVEADVSAACYAAAAAALTGGWVDLEGVDRSSVQGDVGFFDLLGAMGADIDWGTGAVRVSGAERLRALDADLSSMPDQVPTLAALAPFAAGTTIIRNVPHLRLKESDRLAAMAAELGRMGVPVEERPDGLVVEGCWASRQPPADAVIVEAHDDHRVAMSCALVGLRRPGVRVAKPEVVAKSYPGFWDDLRGLMG
ncbi:MAG: 3-phosphoshikimate 1-carboxyvinyltransferase [Acidobacteria bacterium]|nr:3-phosphoshikimate 1-carboxyvinyltransferase [Acidobacteriota bacterium]